MNAINLQDLRVGHARQVNSVKRCGWKHMIGSVKRLNTMVRDVVFDRLDWECWNIEGL